MDFTIDQGVLNYINPPAPLHPALEEHRVDRFSIPQLKGMLEEYKRVSKISSTGDLIPINFGAQQLFAQIHLSAGFISARSGLPEAWNTLNMYQVQSVMRNLDTANTGFFNYKQFFTYIILLLSTPPTEKDLEVIERLADEEGYIYEEPFVKTTFWFDACESSDDPEYTHPFKRRDMIKGLIFKTNSTQIDGKSTAVLDAKNLIDMLSLVGQNKRGFTNFYDYLFAPVTT